MFVIVQAQGVSVLQIYDDDDDFYYYDPPVWLTVSGGEMQT